MAQRKPECDPTAVGMTEEMEWRGVRAGFANGDCLLGKAQWAGAMPSSLIAVAPKIERHGLEAGQLLRERFPLPRGACRAGHQHDPIECLWSGSRLASLMPGELGCFPLSEMIVVAVRSVIWTAHRHHPRIPESLIGTRLWRSPP